MTDPETNKRASFIAQARRRQIIHATIATLDDMGFANTSLAQIAQRAGISAALISYHFQNKHELIDETLITLFNEVAAFVRARTSAADTCRARLHAYIRANLDYRAAYPAHYGALLEIIFNARTAEGIPYYKVNDPDEEEPLIVQLRHILRAGQARDEFHTFNVEVMAYAIHGAIWEYVANPSLVNKIDFETYGSELVRLFDRSVLREACA